MAANSDLREAIPAMDDRYSEILNCLVIVAFTAAIVTPFLMRFGGFGAPTGFLAGIGVGFVAIVPIALFLRRRK